MPQLRLVEDKPHEVSSETQCKLLFVGSNAVPKLRKELEGIPLPFKAEVSPNESGLELVLRVSDVTDENRFEAMLLASGTVREYLKDLYSQYGYTLVGMNQSKSRNPMRWTYRMH